MFFQLRFIEPIFGCVTVEFWTFFEGASFENGQCDAENLALIPEVIADVDISPSESFLDFLRG